MRSTAIVSTQGPALRVLAAAWGNERLRMLWAPATVPGELAEAVALGWAEPTQRAAWEATRGAVRDRAVEAWAEGAMRGAEATYREGWASSPKRMESRCGIDARGESGMRPRAPCAWVAATVVGVAAAMAEWREGHDNPWVFSERWAGTALAMERRRHGDDARLRVT